MNDGERYRRMMFAARAELPLPFGDFAPQQTQMLGIALQVARENEDETDRKKLRRAIKARIKQRARGEFTFIGWQVVLWWILPKLIDWFIAWWFRDKERAKSQEH